MKQSTLSKTDYILYRECKKNVWYKIHKPDIYYQSELSEFDRSIIETGNEVEQVARRLFPEGILIEGRDENAQVVTQAYINKGQEVLFQPFFVQDGYLAAIDVLMVDKVSKKYSIYEVKSNSSVDEKTHYHDLAFQVNLLRKAGLEIDKAYIIHLNSEYVRSGELDLAMLLRIVDVTPEVEGITKTVAAEAAEAATYLGQSSEPAGFCGCVYKGRSRHCSTFQYANPQIPVYGIHDIARIGNSKAKLKELVDNNVFHLDKIPAYIKLTELQQSQVDTYVSNKIVVDRANIAEELKSLTFPLYFLDYETFPAAIPRYNGFSPYTQIPFQYSVHIIASDDAEPTHFDFLHVGPEDPSYSFADSLQRRLGNTGSIIVWHKSFECGRNNEIATRIPTTKTFMDSLNERIYDLEDIFKKQYHIHRDYRGSTSIKRILPVLVPDLSYEDLEIQEGGTAAETWNKITSGSLTAEAKQKAMMNLKVYCGLDSFAMYSIWRSLLKIL